MDNNLWKFWFNHQDDQSRILPLNNDYYSNVIYFIMDCFTNKFEYLSSNILHITGYDIPNFTIYTLIDNIHPEDEIFVANAERICIEYQNMLFYDEHYKYSYRYTYRMKGKGNNYLLIRQTYEALEVNSMGYLAKSIVKLHISTLPIQYTPQRDIIIFDHSLGMNVNLTTVKKLSKREREIVDLVHQGLTSLEIAEKLFVSKMTIDTHRRNILHKTNSTNFIDLMQKIKSS